MTTENKALSRLKNLAFPEIILKWYAILGIYATVLFIFLFLRLQGGNEPNLLQLGPLRFRWYGILIACGVALATLVTSYLAERRGEDANHAWRVLPVVLVSSLVGARLWFVVFTWETYSQHPDRIIAIWEGGIAIQGGVLGGLAGGLIYARLASVKAWRWADFIAPGLVLAQAIGRWGNFMNNEAYGSPINLPWGIKIPCQYRTDGHPGTVDTRCGVTGNPGVDSTFHPTFLYESLWDYGCFLILLFLSLNPRPTWFERKLGWWRRDGDLFLIYWIIYSIGRFFTESLRTDSLTFGGFRTAQVTAIAAILVCSALLFWQHRHDRKEKTGIVA